MGRHSAETTQESYPWRTVFRTGVQVGIGLAAAMPMIVSSSGVPETLPGIGVALAVSATVTRVMAIPAVNFALKLYAPWLSAAPREGSANHEDKII